MNGLHNVYFFIPLFVGLFAQVVKVIIDSYYGKAFTLRSLWSSGGIPSAHSTLTSSVFVMVIFLEGLFSTMTMVVSIFSVLIRYDAMNVRYESGKHAQYINSLRSEIHKVMENDHLSEQNSFLGFDILRERLGHTPVEVFVGILFGIIVTVSVLFLLDTYVISFNSFHNA